MPREALTGWLDTLASFNPVTYLLEGMRSLVLGRWEWGELAKATAVIGAVGILGMALALAALRNRTKQR